jgi:chromosomal replication initiation ATPase DnaA
MKAEQVIEIVADYFGTTPKELKSSKRFTHLIKARRFIMYILRKEYKMTLQSIADLFQQNHANVLFHIKKIEEWLTVYEDARTDLRNITAKVLTRDKIYAASLIGHLQC